MPSIEPLAWDSNFFGYQTGKLEVGKSEHFDAGHFIKNAEPFRLVYVFSQNKLRFEKLKPAEKKIIFSRKPQPAYRPGRRKTIDKNSFQTRSFDLQRDDYGELEKLALESGRFSRFKTDPGFGNDEFQRLYKKWIENSVIGKMAFDVIIIEKENFGKVPASRGKKILGFVSLSQKNKNTAKIDLIAVDETARNQGVASALIAEALHRSNEKGFDELEVATQAKNLAAVELYKKNGFGLKESYFVYHFWNR